MLQRIFRTADDKTLTIVRLALGVVFFAHGAQKVLGWFGGAGFTATLNGFTQHIGIPLPLALLAIAAEFLGGLGLILGFLGRIAAFGIAFEMTVAMLMIHRHFGLFMNWAGKQQGEGFEFHLLAIAIGLLVLVKGSGAVSLDRLLSTSGDKEKGSNLRAAA